MSKGKLLITCRLADVLPRECAAHGYDVVSRPGISRDDLLHEVRDAVGLVVRSKASVDIQVLDAAKQLKFIGRLGSGMEHIAVEEAERRGIRCLNSPEGNSPSVAEHSISLMISLLKGIHSSDRAIRRGQWIRDDQAGRDLSEQTVGIIGYGNTGSRVASRLQAFGCRVLVYDKYKKDLGGTFPEESSLDALIDATDVLSIHLPLNEETKYMVNRSFLSKFKKPIYLINTSRGGIVKTQDLLEAIAEGRISGAALDVFENEPLSADGCKEDIWYKELIGNEKVILTAHIAGVTKDAFHRMASVLSQKIQDFL